MRSFLTNVLMSTAVVAVAGYLGGCASPTGAAVSGVDLWRSHGIRDYRMTVQRSAGMLQSNPHVVFVHNGAVDSVTDTSGAPTPPDGWWHYIEVRTIDEMFGFIDSLGRNPQWTIRVSYDKKFGYPDSLSWWWTSLPGEPVSSENGSDFVIRKFEPIR